MTDDQETEGVEGGDFSCACRTSFRGERVNEHRCIFRQQCDDDCVLIFCLQVQEVPDSLSFVARKGGSSLFPSFPRLRERTASARKKWTVCESLSLQLTRNK